jgi:LysR family glycine cleavage system transcriptional activator
MPDHLPPLLGLEAFEVSARHESFAAAAAELAVSQSTVSHRIRALEAHLGHRLFERLPRGVRLTERGRAYLPSIRDAFEQVLGSTTGVFGQPTTVQLTMRAPIAYNTLWLPQFVERFNAEHPNIEITATSSIFTAMLSAENVDLELWVGSGSWPGFENKLMFNDPLVMVASPSTAARLGAGVDIDAVIDQPLIRVIGSEDHWDKLLTTLERTRAPNTQDVRVDSTIVALGYVMTSGRIALAQRHLVEPLIRRGDLTRLLDLEAPTAASVYLTIPQRDTRAKAEAVLFRDWLLENARPNEPAEHT